MMQKVKQDNGDSFVLETPVQENKLRVQESVKREGGNHVQLGEQKVQVVQTDSGEILLVTGGGWEGGGGNQLGNINRESGQFQGNGGEVGMVGDSDQVDEEMEKIKAMKIAQIKEQQVTRESS